MNIINNLMKDLSEEISKDVSKEVVAYMTRKNSPMQKAFVEASFNNTQKSFQGILQEAQKRRKDIFVAKKRLSKILDQMQKTGTIVTTINTQLVSYQTSLTKAYVFIQKTGNLIRNTNFVYSFLFERTGENGQKEAKIANLNLQDIIPTISFSISEKTGEIALNLTNLFALKALERNITRQTDTQKLIANLYLNLLYTKGGSRRTSLVDETGKKQKLTGRGKKGQAFEAASNYVIEEGLQNLKNSILDLSLAKKTATFMKNNPAPFYTGKDTSKGLRSLGGQKTRMELKKFELDAEWYGARLTGEKTILNTLLKIEEICKETKNPKIIEKNLKQKLFDNTNTRIVLSSESEKIVKQIMSIKLN